MILLKNCIVPVNSGQSTLGPSRAACSDLPIPAILCVLLVFGHLRCCECAVSRSSLSERCAGEAFTELFGVSHDVHW